MKLTMEVLNEVKQTILHKKEVWQAKFPNLNFDDNGRVVLGKISSLNKATLERELYNNNMTHRFNLAFNQYLEEQKYKIKLNNGEYSDDVPAVYNLDVDIFLSNLCHMFKKENNKLVTVKTSKVLAGVQAIWEKNFDLYVSIVKEIKNLRQQGKSYEDEDIKKYSEIKKYMEEDNLYIKYQTVMNDLAGLSDVCLSINPLDLLTSSQKNDDSNLVLTKFESCWSTRIQKQKDIYYVFNEGCYSNPKAMVALGSIENRCMIYVVNNRSLDISPEFTLLGYKERSHAWFDDDGIWIERMYPTKSQSRRQEIMNVISEAGLPIIKEVSSQKEFNFQDIKGNKKYFMALRNEDTDNHLFLDRVGFDEDFKLTYLPQDRVDYSYNNYDRLPRLRYDICPHCKGEISMERSSLYFTPEGEVICEYCFAKKYFTCPECGQIHKKSKCKEIDGVYLCDNCIKTRLKTCPDCGQVHYRYREINNKKICISCYNNYVICVKCSKAENKLHMHVRRPSYGWVSSRRETWICNECNEREEEEERINRINTSLSTSNLTNEREGEHVIIVDRNAVPVNSSFNVLNNMSWDRFVRDCQDIRTPYSCAIRPDNQNERRFFFDSVDFNEFPILNEVATTYDVNYDDNEDGEGGERN
jgi:hypothetical protein